jgi:hypothetical protein
MMQRVRDTDGALARADFPVFRVDADDGSHVVASYGGSDRAIDRFELLWSSLGPEQRHLHVTSLRARDEWPIAEVARDEYRRLPDQDALPQPVSGTFLLRVDEKPAEAHWFGSELHWGAALFLDGGQEVHLLARGVSRATVALKRVSQST